MAAALDLASLSRGARALFYMVSPSEASFQRVEDVPQYVEQATPFFIGLMVLEVVVGWLKKGVPVINVSDGITSISAGVISRLPVLLMRSCELTSYLYVWKHFHLVELAWDSAWTWWIAFLGVDFCYYWVHRFAHEVAILWAAHQVHHSSEYYHLTTALRQSITQQLSSWVFYLPMALAVPPPVFVVHLQFNLLYQFWIHTELVRDLGPLEWLLNTPSHHRVHHGRNLYCIDKNYGGVLIIWDRLFGTFAPEMDKVVYGLVFPINTFDVLHVQLHYYVHLWRTSNTYKKASERWSTFFQGPSWSPGQSRLGDHSKYPQVTGEEEPHDPGQPMSSQVYVVMHFLLVLGLYHHVSGSPSVLSQSTILLITSYILLTLTSLGLIIDQRPMAPIMEMLRCVVMVMMQRFGYMTPLFPSLAVEAFASLSLLFWGLQTFSQINGIKNKSD